MSIGYNIKRLRSNYGLSQKDLAIIAGVKDKTVSAWENDRIDPRMGAIQKIADHFGIKKSDIIEMPTSTDNTESTFFTTEDETELVKLYRGLDDVNKNFVKSLAIKLNYAQNVVVSAAIGGGNSLGGEYDGIKQINIACGRRPVAERI